MVDEEISKEKSTALKGIMAVLVMICHLRGGIPALNNTILGSLCTVLGYLAVSVFFFLSGYGLTISYRDKKEQYISEFGRNRLLSFYCICLFWIVLYIVFDFLRGIQITFKNVFQSVTFGNTVVINGWYLQTIFVLYILFFVCARMSKTLRGLNISVFIGLLFYICLCLVMNLSTTWYESVFSFGLGILIGTKGWRGQQKNYVAQTIFIFISFAITLMLGNTTIIAIAGIRVICKMISAILFVLIVLLLSEKICIENVVTKYLGILSFEIYMIQGMVMSLFRGGYLHTVRCYIYNILFVFHSWTGFCNSSHSKENIYCH